MQAEVILQVAVRLYCGRHAKAVHVVCWSKGLSVRLLVPGLLQAFDALPAGGAFVALDVIIDDSRRCNVWGLLMSLDMLMEFEAEGAADYTFEVGVLRGGCKQGKRKCCCCRTTPTCLSCAERRVCWRKWRSN